MIEAVCPSCRHTIRARSDDIGKVVACGRCDTECIVPSARVDSGAVFGAYKLIHPLGAGGTGEVHLAEDMSRGTEVALKILFLEDVDDTDIQRFLKEARLASKLEHPCIVKILDTGSVKDTYFLAMEYVDGNTLDVYLDENGPMGEAAALEVVQHVAEAMAYAWDNFQLLHRDIKPGNVLLGFDGQVKVMDFGIAKSLLLDQTRLTDPQTIVGTPQYMSPEQCAPGRMLDFRADVYSLGATLFHLLTEEFPFNGKTPLDIVRKQMFGKLPDPQSYKHDLSTDTVRLIRTMMAKSASGRHESWQELIKEVKAVRQVVEG